MRKLSFLILGLILNIIIYNHAFNYNKKSERNAYERNLKNRKSKKILW